MDSFYLGIIAQSTIIIFGLSCELIDKVLKKLRKHKETKKGRV